MTRPDGAGSVPDAMAPELFPVKRLTWETSDTFTCELDAAPRGGFRFEPGQFNMLYGFGVGESAISIAGDPARPERLVHTIRRVGAVTEVLARLKRGEALGVRGPFGRGWPLSAARGRHLLVVAGGIGLAPLRPVVLHALAHAADFASVTLVYGARTAADLLYVRELSRWAKRLRVEVTVDRGDADWHGHTGVVTKLLASVVREPGATTAMMCGPELMMRFAARELGALGVAESDVVVSGERSMKCGVGLCGHCQLGPYLLCRDGPTFTYDRIAPLLTVREL
jgi:NAD(P)H-flavin reductase